LSRRDIVASGVGWGATTGAGREYLLDAKNGATMLSIPAGHTLDAACMVLGELEVVDALLASRRPVARHRETGQDVPVTAADQIALCGTLEGGALLSLHYRGGISRGVNFLWEINGTDGDLSITGDDGHLQYGRVKISGGRGAAREMTELPVPDSYRMVDLDPSSHAYAVAHAYHRLLDALDGTFVDMPTFETALQSHRRIETIETAARTGQRQWMKTAPARCA
jgi:predicted dehydrogenase